MAPRCPRKASHASSASSISGTGGGTYVAVASVEPGGPIQFCEVLNSPGVREPISPRSSRSCKVRTSSSDRGSSRRRSTPKRKVPMQLRTSRRSSRATSGRAAATWSSSRSDSDTSAPSMRDEHNAS